MVGVLSLYEIKVYHIFMEIERDGGNAFPIQPNFPGMTLRDWFAGQALTGLIVNTQKNHIDNDESKRLAEISYKLANSMINEKFIASHHKKNQQK
jgi:hypothetical protein